MSVSRPIVNVYNAKNEIVGQLPVPDVFQTPIRPDIVSKIHKFCLMNLRQPHGVDKWAGKRPDAESWGTGRAVARIPRVAGGGTHRAGQGAFGNMCRGGRMFAPLKTWRVWAHVVPRNQKRYAHASAIAASSVTALVMARGHKIEGLNEIPLVVTDDIQNLTKTKAAIEFLKKIRAYSEVIKSKNSKRVRAGHGKNRNRKYKQSLGPLIVYKEDKGISRSFRNVPGVDLSSVNRLNLLQLAPGGQVGRFVIWTQSAFEELGKRYGSASTASTLKRRNGQTYVLPRSLMNNTDLARLMASDEVQNVVRPPMRKPRGHRNHRSNPLRNFGIATKLNKYLVKQKRAELLAKVAAAKGFELQTKERAAAQKKKADREAAALLKFQAQ